MLVGGPHAQQLSAVLDMLATRAAASVETFFLPQREPEEAGIGRFAALGAYYASDVWKEDFAADEAGLLPQDLPRGVLSEDGIYNALTGFGV